MLTVKNSTITSNTARLGGGILSWNDDANTTTVKNSTIAFNAATDRGLGGIGGQGSLSFIATIVSDNTFAGQPSNCSGSIVSLGSNLESGTDCSFTAGSDLPSTDPELGPLGDNGGPTDTRSLSATSPAIDAVSGDCPPPSVDQRGIERPQGASCDIGAFELIPPPTRQISGTVRDAEGATVPDVLVQACLETVCETSTSNSDGFYGFSELAPGVYTVRALPTDPALLAVQETADVTSDSVTGLVLRLSASGASSTPNGPSAFQVSGCVGGSLHYVATGDGTPLGSGDVTDGANNSPIDGVFTIDVSGLSVGHPVMLQFDITITCPDSPTETQTAVLFADPAGTVVDDAAGGAALTGATVTLLDCERDADPGERPPPLPRDRRQPGDERRAWRLGLGRGAGHLPGEGRQDELRHGDERAAGRDGSQPRDRRRPPPLVRDTQPPPGFPPTNPPPSGLPDPVAGVNFNVVPISGTVLVNGVLLPDAKQIPFGAIIDATNGIVSITTIGPNGLPQTAFFYGGVFQLLQAPGGITNLLLVGGDFSVCPVVTAKAKAKAKRRPRRSRRPGRGQCKAVLAAQAKAPPKNSKKVVRAVWGSGKGSFRTTGRFSSATVRGTLWYTADRCDGTYTKVNVGSVTVLDFPRKKVQIVKAPSSVLVRPK